MFSCRNSWPDYNIIERKKALYVGKRIIWTMHTWYAWYVYYCHSTTSMSYIYSVLRRHSLYSRDSWPQSICECERTQVPMKWTWKQYIYLHGLCTLLVARYIALFLITLIQTSSSLKMFFEDIQCLKPTIKDSWTYKPTHSVIEWQWV